PGPPPSLSSRRYAIDVAEVQALGRSDSTVRSAAQLDVAKFWSESAFTLWTRGIRNLAIARGLDELETARLMAMTSLAAADTLISCWEAKYHYFAWRPVHAITRADTDGNPLTIADPTWTALLNQNHPEYPAGHACFGSAVVTALRRYFRSSFVSMSLDSTAAALTSPVHQYERLAEINDEVEGARIWAGVHFRHTLRVSKKLGETVAKHALQGRFHRVKDCRDYECDDGEDDEEDGHDPGPHHGTERR
ncbi:MAG: vanadium-dependent haloperoxidase, partial [Myxococcaceae bacterium]